MLDNASSLNKLMILYMLDNVDFQLTNAQISDFMIGKAQVHYFRLQTILSDMEAVGLIHTRKDSSTTYYEITEEGKKTLVSLSENLSADIMTDIRIYLQDHRIEMRTASSTSADYTLLPSGDYRIQCSVKEGGSELIRLNLTVPTESAAKTLTANWKEKSSEVYEAIMKLLI
ncbi:MAG: DUF4364 family protein [Eubacterium sp.]|nr:DUF4364 family protein [Eubacterium sp.]